MALKTIEILRGATSCALFAIFGIGALVISPLMLVLRRPNWCQPVVRKSWQLIVFLFVATGLIRLDATGLVRVRGAVIAANHPSLIDVVLLSVLLPRTLYVAKHALLGNPFLATIVKATSLPVDASLPEVAAPYLAAGWNVLVFPEGTRTPLGEVSALGTFHRGAAQLSLRTGAPLVAVGISMTRRLLAKHQQPWDMGAKRVTYCFRSDDEKPVAVDEGESPHSAAVRVTAELERRIRGLL